MPPPKYSPELVKVLGDLRSALMGIHSSLDLITSEMLESHTCDASTSNQFGTLGPCVLRKDHDGPLHVDRQEQGWMNPPPPPIDIELVGMPTGWSPCTDEYFQKLIMAGFNGANCGNIVRLPSGNLNISHLHPREIDSPRSSRDHQGLWSPKTPEDALTREQEWENSEITAWWRQHGTQ